MKVGVMVPVITLTSVACDVLGSSGGGVAPPSPVEAAALDYQYKIGY